ncbi:ABC transporter [Cellulomonas marina]|uniref:ABC-type quaternary amine transporter n=1 Tax=Cellulomonas marina TaxID=988821 RepID=A0A1I0YDN0_9CELL|nr:ABC transporter ATP-binding protein [Cellulomonas marina]GIG29629.1 ABC transporter [Cellulomonas marina]SFB10468.1 thiamine transport system ATP-binding protein [Cellulomonas marina]
MSETASAGPGAARGLEVRDLVVRYAATGPAAVDGVSLAVADGVLALLGPSGCGKSSLLRAVAGLEPVAGGDVRWDGASVVEVPVHRRGFGLLFQDGQLFPHRDVGGNVAYGLEGPGDARPSRATRRARVAELLELVGLAGFADRSVATLSGGERQRVALARALAPRPRLLLLDEPLSALDQGLRERLAEDLRAALAATGTAAVLVTHDQDEAAAVADRVAVMSAGRLLQVGTPTELWRSPAGPEVAAFLGFEAVVPRAVLGAGDAATVALAPGALVVASSGAGTTDGRVVRVRARRGRTEVLVSVQGLGVVTAAAPVGWTGSVGSSVPLVVDPDRVVPVGARSATG